MRTHARVDVVEQGALGVGRVQLRLHPRRHRVWRADSGASAMRCRSDQLPPHTGRQSVEHAHAVVHAAQHHTLGLSARATLTVKIVP